VTRLFTCIICPNGCHITAEVLDDQIHKLEGALCLRGEDYVRQELTDPRRTIATSVLVEGGELPLASVRLTGSIPKGEIFPVMEEIKALHFSAPVATGQMAIQNVRGLGSDVIFTKDVRRRTEQPKEE